MSADQNEPLMMRCEGSGCPPIRTTIDPTTFSANGGGYVGMCSMCGEYHFVLDGGSLAEHQRKDVMAMIARGDFG